jgi:hypothetical protein
MTRHAAWSRAPVLCAWLRGASITARSPRPCRRPRRLTAGSLFFEHQQRRGLGERFLFPRELALEHTNARGRRE